MLRDSTAVLAIGPSGRRLHARLVAMKAIRVRVENGRISGEAPGLPDGDVELCLVEPEPEMSDEELSRLNAALERGVVAIAEGRFRPASQVLARSYT